MRLDRRVDEEPCVARSAGRLVDAICFVRGRNAVCINVCPMDLLAIDRATQKAYMKHDECWYCMPCGKDFPTGAVRVAIPSLLR